MRFRLQGSMMRRIIIALAIIALTLGFKYFKEQRPAGPLSPAQSAPDQQVALDLKSKNSGTKLEYVVEYLHKHGKLPPNYKTKKEARDLGWDPKSQNLAGLWDDAAIGGDRFRNYEKLLPEGSKYYECDIGYEKPKKGRLKRGPKRLVYTFNQSGKLTIYYTQDHYKSFKKIDERGKDED